MSSSSARAKLVPTNLRPGDLIMDTRGDKDCRYYCLPPYRGSSATASKKHRSGYRFHLVFQGHIVGTFDSCILVREEAKASLSGYPDSANRGYDTKEECIDAWQKLCVLGIHPHPVDPAYLSLPSARASVFVNTSPRKSRVSIIKPKAEDSVSAKGEAPPLMPAGSAAGRTELLANLKRYCSPLPSPPPSPATQRGEASATYINFAIRGGGIVSSSPMRSEQRYLESQRRGEQPDMLVTRSFEQASLFALEDAENDAENFEETF
ncbi:hypothetical protein C8R47DRAFT_1079922 [Mycena vitilis]|nr:hypothetical protein C8R47DRAFT_1079922 [Mycena vitilis]